MIAFLCVFLFALCGMSVAATPEYVDSFDPAKGFKPAQRDLTEVFLQLAGSLESNGSPVPYLRHVAAEHQRIENLYRQKFGKAPASFRPDYLTDEYINKLAKNWDLLSPKLGLDAYAKEFGHTMRDAIKGTRGTGTIIVDILNQHQAKVFNSIVGKSERGADFESLSKELIVRLELNKKHHEYEGYEVARRDAVSFSLDIQGVTLKLFTRIDQGLKPDAAEAVKAVLQSAIIDTGMMAQSELEAGIADWAIANPSTARR